jgi:hypothetical protein
MLIIIIMRREAARGDKDSGGYRGHKSQPTSQDPGSDPTLNENENNTAQENSKLVYGTAVVASSSTKH